MALVDLKLTETDYSGNDVSALPDNPSAAGYSAAQLKARFDNVGKNVVGERLNSLIDYLLSVAGAGDIGVTAIAGLALGS